MQLDVRSAVALRRVPTRTQTLFYLSLFDDEIDSRLEAFLAVGQSTLWSEPVLAAAALRLEPTDAIVITSRHGEIFVARGGAANFPLYWTATADSILVSTVLPVDQQRRLSRPGLITSLASAWVANQNEPNLTADTPLDGWFRLRRGAVSSLSASAGRQSERPLDLAASHDVAHDRVAVIEAIRSAFDIFGSWQQRRPRALVELSGGFDSTLAAIAARAHAVELLGVSLHFPYYEFRFEEQIQKAAAESLAISRIRLDGTTLLPFAPSDWWPRLDEPSISVIGLKQALTIARIAASEGLDRVLVGHGGDQLFAEELLSSETIRHPLARGAFSKTGWRAVRRVLALAESSPALLSRSALTFSYDARFDVTFKEAFGTIGRSPFTDLAVIRCGLSWAELSARLGLRQGKSILADAFAAELPSAVTGRKGKVPWDGVCARGYAQHASVIVEEIERVRGPLEHLGLDVRWLSRRVAQLAEGKKSTTAREDREVIAGYALATWLRSWGVERVADCAWSC